MADLDITSTVIGFNSQSGDARLTYLLSRLVSHLHDFARETRLSTDEWAATLNFLVACGQISSDTRNEFILLSDVLGLSILVDAINHPKPPGATEGSVLGPFHTDDAPALPNGGLMSSDARGQPMLAVCTVKDTQGLPIAGAKVSVWESDSTGNYDVQYADRERLGPNGRCTLTSDERGRVWFRCIKPVSYPIPGDGPVGNLMQALQRHRWRPAHIHFMVEKPGWDQLVTAIFFRDDPHVSSDAVLGVKQGLIVDLDRTTGQERLEYGVDLGTWLLRYNFVLATEEAAASLRDENTKEAMRQLGLHMKLVDHLPVSDLD